MVGSVPRPIGWDTAQRSLEAGYEQAQHRRDEDLPVIPDLDPTPLVDVDPGQLTEVAAQLGEAGREAARREIVETVEELREAAGLHKDFDAGEAVHGGYEEFMRRWRSGDRTPDP